MLSKGITHLFAVGVFAAFIGKLSFADVVKSPVRPVGRPVLMSRENLPSSRLMYTYVSSHTAYIQFLFIHCFTSFFIFFSF